MISSDSKLGVRWSSREVLCSVGILPISHRVRIAGLLFQKQVRAQEVYGQFNRQSRFVSRVTGYNTSKISVDYFLLRQAAVHTSRGFYDSNISPHHHFFDNYTGELKNIEAEQFEILGMSDPPFGKSVAGGDVVVRVKSTG